MATDRQTNKQTNRWASPLREAALAVASGGLTSADQCTCERSFTLSAHQSMTPHCCSLSIKRSMLVVVMLSRRLRLRLKRVCVVKMSAVVTLQTLLYLTVLIFGCAGESRLSSQLSHCTVCPQKTQPTTFQHSDIKPQLNALVCGAAM